MSGKLVASALALMLLLMTLTLTCASSGAAEQSSKRAVDQVIMPLMRKDGIPGMAIGITIGQQTYVFNYGLASKETKASVGPDTLFEVGSVSKTLTATLTSLAQVDGHLDLSDHVSRYLPALAGTPFGEATLLNLGTHTAGDLPLQVPEDVEDQNQLLAYLKGFQPSHPIGTQRTYSNIGIGTLGLIAAISLHQDFDGLMEQRLLPMLGMSHTYIHIPPERMGDYAQGYKKDGTPVRVAPGMLSSEAYGIKTTAADLIGFVKANLGEEPVPDPLRRAIENTHIGYFKAGPMVQDLVWEQYPYPVALKTMLKGNQLLSDTVAATSISPPLQSQSAALFNKTGTTNGFAAYVVFIPDKQIGVVLLANRNFDTEERIAAVEKIIAALDRR